MSRELFDQIARLRSRTLDELAANERYFADTRRAWRLAKRLAEAGQRADVEAVSGESVADLLELAGKAQGYVTGALAEAAFQQSLAVFEAFVADLLTAWHVAYPAALGQRQVLLADILAGDRDAVVADKVAEVVAEVVHGPPAKWFGWLAKYAPALGRPTDDQTARFAEAKASRDLLAHNRGVVNKTYLSKAGPALARYREGQRIEVPEPYLLDTWRLLAGLTVTITTIARADPPADLPPPAPPG